MKRASVKALVKSLGQKYSEILGIDLSSGDDKEVFKWFLASILFAAPITESSAIETYKCFQKHDVLEPKKILDTGWDGLVKILDEGGYTRYDFKTADKLLEVMGNLTRMYRQSLTVIYDCASDAFDLERRLKSLGKGIGNITVSIFLRELRGLWPKGDPEPTPLVIEAAEQLGIIGKRAGGQDALQQLKIFWAKNKVRGASFVNFETALLRVGKNYLRKGKPVPFL